MALTIQIQRVENGIGCTSQNAGEPEPTVMVFEMHEQDSGPAAAMVDCLEHVTDRLMIGPALEIIEKAEPALEAWPEIGDDTPDLVELRKTHNGVLVNASMPARDGEKVGRVISRCYQAHSRNDEADDSAMAERVCGFLLATFGLASDVAAIVNRV
jgi:hypothetical protein